MALLEAHQLSKRFGGVVAVNGFDISLEKNTLQAIIGPNGAGKTTIFNLITGIYPPTSGEVLFQNKPLTGLPPFKIAALGIARTFQNIRLFPDFSILDNVRTACHMDANYTLLEGLIPSKRRINQERNLTERARALLDLVGLTEREVERARNLPYGHQRRLEIARALALEPKLLLLDEPAAGMNPDETQRLMDFIREIKDKFKLTILMIEHHMEVVMGLCDYITVIDFGKTIAQGTPEEIQANPIVIQAYLGVGE